MKVRRMASWTLRAAPGVYRAARGAGLGRRDALRALESSAYAVALARRRYPRRWRAENAVRHFVWQAWLTAAFGRAAAEAIGAAHERLSRDAADSAADRVNNLRGQEYGQAHTDEIRSDAMLPALSALADEAGRLWNSGHLMATR